MEEPINKRLFEKYFKDESGLKDSTTDWEMSQSSVSDIFFFLTYKNTCLKEVWGQKVILQLYESEAGFKLSFLDNIIFKDAELISFQWEVVLGCLYENNLVCKNEGCFSATSHKLFADTLLEVNDLALVFKVF